ncbi:MAG TPA: aldehyde dehydrogenase family protein [Acidimicrobiales bacterium]
MASIEQLRPVLTEPVATFDSLEPGSGAVVDTFPVDDAESVRRVVARAEVAALWWRSLGFDGRATHLRRYKSEIARRIDELADLIHRENGKPHGDAVLETTLVIDHLAWASGHAKKVLGPRRVPSGMMAAHHAASVEYQPLGVVGVIGPWNYPVFTPMGSIAYALAAGNAVVFKPSEYTPAIGRWLVDAWARAVPEGRDVFLLVTGLGETGAALCRSGVDKIAFTGSAATGRKVMGACAEGLVPVLMECGGKDALLVDADADLDAAAEAALWCGMSNGGQTCIGTERVYVADAAYDRFVDILTTKAKNLTPGSGAGASWGPPTMPSQVDTIRRHVTDAVARGGRAVVGGESSVDVSGVGPTILVDVPEDAEAVREETFGPTLTVTRVKDIEEGLALANDSEYGLGGAIFTKSRKRGVELARRMRSGMTSVNSIMTFAMVPGLPFGGVGESGFGRIHGPDGLREFTRPKAVTSQRFALPVNLTSFARPDKATELTAKLMGVVHGRSR